MNLKAIFQDFEKVVKKDSNISISLFDTKGQLIDSSQEDTSDLNLKLLKKSNSHVAIYKIEVLDIFYGYLVVKTKEAYKYLDDVGSVLFETFKTRIELENEKQQRDRILSANEKLIESIIYGNSINISLSLMKQVLLKSNIYRIPIVCVNLHSFASDVLINLKYRINDNQTFYSEINENTIILFMHINDKQFDGYEEFLTAMLKDLEDWGLENTTFYVGTLVNNINDYEQSYLQALWLKDYITPKTGSVVFFKDYYLTYLIMTSKEFYNSFDNYIEKIEQENMDLKQVKSVLENLIDCDFNLSLTAKKMFIHKNTLLYRINKLEQNIFGFNIRNNFQNKVFVGSFLNYMKYIKIR